MFSKIIPFTILFLLSTFAHAYSFSPSDVLLQPKLGAKINVVRLELDDEETPEILFVVGVDADYSLSQHFGFNGTFRPGFSAGFFDFDMGAGVKYRAADVDLPIAPYASIQMTFSVLVPVNNTPQHYNVGLRPALGVEYFLMRDFAFNVEINSQPSFSFATFGTHIEFAAGFMCGFSWRV